MDFKTNEMKYISPISYSGLQYLDISIYYKYLQQGWMGVKKNPNGLSVLKIVVGR